MALSLVAQEPELAFYTRRAQEHGGPVLVLGSAKGRVPWALGEHGLTTLGVEPSARMAATAEERRAHVPEEVSARVRLLTADLRSLRLDERFPTLVAPQNALGLMGSRADLEALLATVRHHLSPGGLFLFDVYHPPQEPVVPRDEGPLSALEPRRPAFTLHLRERRQPGAPLGIHRLQLRHFSPEEVEEALAASGLTLRERYGHFGGKPFDLGDTLQVGVADG
jgi:SAM-dependent methyltransferase